MSISNNEGSKKALRNNPLRGNTPLTDILERCKLPLSKKVVRQAAIELEVAGIGIHYSKGSKIWLVPDYLVPATEKILRRLGRYHNSVFCKSDDSEDPNKGSEDENDDDYEYV